LLLNDIEIDKVHLRELQVTLDNANAAPSPAKSEYPTAESKRPVAEVNLFFKYYSISSDYLSKKKRLLL